VSQDGGDFGGDYDRGYAEEESVRTATLACHVITDRLTLVC